MTHKKNLSLTTGFLWLFCSTLGQYILQFISMVVLARLLSPRDFGVVGLAMVVVNLLKLFSQLGVGPALIYFNKLNDLHKSTAQTISVVISFFLFITVYFMAPLIEKYFEAPGLTSPVRFLALLLPISAPSIIYISLMQRDYQFKLIAITNMLSYGIGYVLVAVPLAYKGAGVWALVFGYISQAIILTISTVVLKRKSLVGFRYRHSYAAQLLNYGVGFSLGRLANFFAGQGDNLVVGKVLGTGSLGLYGRAYQLMSMPALLIGQAMDKVLFPAMSRQQHSVQKLSSMYWDSLAFTGLLAIPVSVLLSFTSSEVVLLVFGSQWIEAVEPFKILSYVLVFRMAYRIPDALSRAVGSVYHRAWRQLVYALMVIGLSAVGGYINGLSGVAIGVGISVVANFILMHQLSMNSIVSDKRSIYLIMKWSALYAGCYAVCKFISFGLKNMHFPGVVTILIFGVGVVVATASIMICGRTLFSSERRVVINKMRFLYQRAGI